MARIIPLVLAGILALLAFAGIAKGTGDEGPIDERVNNDERQLYVDQDTFFASVSSYTKVESAPWFKFSVDAHDELEIAASYGFNDKVRTDVGMDLKFIALIEYADTNGNSAYDEWSERMASFYPLSLSAYETDFINKQRDWQGTMVDEKTTIIQNGSWDWDYSSAFERGFVKGWGLGFRMGGEDGKANVPPQPDPAVRIDEDYAETIRVSLEKELLVRSYPVEIHKWLLDGSIKAFNMGFKNAYDLSYEKSHVGTPTPTTDSAKPAQNLTSASPTTANDTSTVKVSDQGTAPNSTTTPSVSSAVKSGEDPTPDSADPEISTSSDSSSTNMSQTSSLASNKSTTARSCSTRGGEETARYVASVEKPAQNIIPKYRPLKIHRQIEGDVTNFVIETWDNNGYFGLRCVVSSEFSNVANGYISPGSMKIDIMIGNYPFKANDSKLALLMEMGSDIGYAGQVDMERKDESYDQSFGLAYDEEEIGFSTGNFSGFFSWVKAAEADGRDVPVRNRILNSVYGNYWEENGGLSRNHRGVLFCYPRSEAIVHDTKLGFIEIESVNIYTMNLSDNMEIREVAGKFIGDPVLYLLGCSAVVLLVASTWKRRGASRVGASPKQ
jgi:hypothetical protein